MLSTTSNKANIPWVEKYRPNQFDDIVLSNINRTIFKNIIEKNYFPNLLFYGPPGTGKTTTIINLINEYQKKHNQTNKTEVIFELFINSFKKKNWVFSILIFNK